MFQREVDSSVELSRHDDDDRQVGNGEIDVAVSDASFGKLAQRHLFSRQARVILDKALAYCIGRRKEPARAHHCAADQKQT